MYSQTAVLLWFYRHCMCLHSHFIPTTGIYTKRKKISFSTDLVAKLPSRARKNKNLPPLLLPILPQRMGPLRLRLWPRTLARNPKMCWSRQMRSPLKMPFHRRREAIHGIYWIFCLFWRISGRIGSSLLYERIMASVQQSIPPFWSGKRKGQFWMKVYTCTVMKGGAFI